MSAYDFNLIIEFCSKFYIWEVLIIVAAILLTQFIKLPIKAKAVALQEKYGVDKSMLTQITIIFPYFLSAIFVFVLYWYRSGWAIELLKDKCGAMLAEVGVLGSGAIGLYELVKKIIQGTKAIKEKKAIEKKPPEAVSYRVKGGK